ncbi:hypothetical protein O3P69_018374 [Scylla paramamosain]|uniref:Uncharacterized protein n=1 Tax=Scylla paramamosain TaxID=85552 RepID=A0AAW0SAF3_SCYPA
MASTSGEGDVPGQSVLRKNVSNPSTPRADRRGKHVPKHAMPLSRKNLVECHIKSFPTVSSHYTRAKSPLMRYLDTEMTMKKMYFLYKEWLFDNHEDEEPVTFSYYKKVVQGFRLGFKPPSTDTCSKCDRYEVSKKDANTEEEAQGIQAQWDEHLSFAKEGMKAMADMQKDNDPRHENITHTYLIPGHSYMACDRAFGHIEKYIRRVVNIYDLKGYVRAIKLCTTSRYHVIVLRNTDFLDFEVLQKSITHRKPKPPLQFPGCPVLSATVNILSTPTIRRLQPGKLQHLQQLLEFIPNVNQPYLQFIIRKQQELDNTEEDDSTEDEDEDHLEYDSDSEDIVDDPQPLQDEDNTGE